MKNKKGLIITLICLIGIGISILLLSGHRPFKDLEAADITSANVRLSPPDTTIQIVETEELASYLNEVVIYNKDNSYTEYAGQGAIFTLSLADGSQVEITAFNPLDVYKRQIRHSPKCRIGTAKFFTLLLLLYRTLAKSQGMKQFMAN